MGHNKGGTGLLTECCGSNSTATTQSVTGSAQGDQKGPKKKQVPLKQVRLVVGRLQHAARTIPAARSFFIPLNNALQGLPTFTGLSQHSHVRHALIDISGVIHDLASCPTHVSKLVKAPLDYIGYCNAGGVWFGGQKWLHPII